MKELHVVYSVPDYVELKDLDFIGLKGHIEYPAPDGVPVRIAINPKSMFFEETFLSQNATASIQYCAGKVSSNEI